MIVLAVMFFISMFITAIAYIAWAMVEEVFKEEKKDD